MINDEQERLLMCINDFSIMQVANDSEHRNNLDALENLNLVKSTRRNTGVNKGGYIGAPRESLCLTDDGYRHIEENNLIEFNSLEIQKASLERALDGKEPVTQYERLYWHKCGCIEVSDDLTSYRHLDGALYVLSDLENKITAGLAR